MQSYKYGTFGTDDGYNPSGTKSCESVPRLGQIKDKVKGVSQKAKIVEWYLKDYEYSDIKRRTHHSGEVADRYLRDHNCAKVLREKHIPQEIAFATGLSISLVNKYLDLINEIEGTDEEKLCV